MKVGEAGVTLIKRGRGLPVRRTVLGLIVSALAISLGAPFWFDVIGRGLSLHSSGPRPISATAAPTRNPS